MNEEQYRRRIAHERSLGQAFVGTRLDRMCYDLGLDPTEVWRIPRWQEERDRRDRIEHLARWHYGTFVIEPSAFLSIGSVA